MSRSSTAGSTTSSRAWRSSTGHTGGRTPAVVAKKAPLAASPPDVAEQRTVGWSVASSAAYQSEKAFPRAGLTEAASRPRRPDLVGRAATKSHAGDHLTLAVDASPRMWHREKVPSMDPRLQRAILRKLAQIHASRDLDSLRVPPWNLPGRSSGIGVGSTASASTTNGASVSSGPKEGLKMSSSSTTTERWMPVTWGRSSWRTSSRGSGSPRTSSPCRSVSRHGASTKSYTGSVASPLTLRCAWGVTFGMDPQFWINLQSHYNLEVETDALGDSLDSIVPLQAA